MIKEANMKPSKLLTAIAMASLVTTPIAAQASDNSPARVASKAGGEAVAGDNTVWIIVGAVVLIGLIVLIADNGHNHPASP